MTGRRPRSNADVDPWLEDEREAEKQQAYKPLSAEEARAVLVGQPKVSPWRVIAVQVLVGVCLAAVVALTPAGRAGAFSVLYGMLVVAVPGVLMARGMTSKLSLASPTASAVSFMWWEMVKIGVSVLMLALAPKVVQPLNWLLLLLAVVVCIKVYWVALLWRGSRKS